MVGIPHDIQGGLGSVAKKDKLGLLSERVKTFYGIFHSFDVGHIVPLPSMTRFFPDLFRANYPNIYAEIGYITKIIVYAMLDSLHVSGIIAQEFGFTLIGDMAAVPERLLFVPNIGETDTELNTYFHCKESLLINKIRDDFFFSWYFAGNLPIGTELQLSWGMDYINKQDWNYYSRI